MISAIQACRLSALVEEGIDRIELLSSLSPGSFAASSSGERGSTSGNSSTTKTCSAEASRHMRLLLDEQIRLQSVYADLSARREAALKQEQGHSWIGSRVNETLECDISNCNVGLRYITRCINQAMSKDEPVNVKKMIEVHKQRVFLVDVLKKTMFELKELSFETLRDKVHYHLEQEDLLNETKHRQEIISHTRAELERTIMQEQAFFDSELCAKNKKIAEFSARLKRATIDIDITLQYSSKASKATIESILRERNAQMTSLQIELDEKTNTLQTEQLVAARTEKYLSRKIEDQRSTLDEWESKYRTNVVDKQNALKKISAERQITLENLRALEHRLEVEKADKRRAKQRQKSMAQAALKQQKQLKFHTAAKIIQTVFRIHRQKRQAKKPVKKGGNKKGKKGAKK